MNIKMHLVILLQTHMPRICLRALKKPIITYCERLNTALQLLRAEDGTHSYFQRSRVDGDEGGNSSEAHNPWR